MDNAPSLHAEDQRCEDFSRGPVPRAVLEETKDSGRRGGKGEDVEIRISLVDGDQAAGLESLADWLHGEPELAGRVSVAGTEPRAGELGALVDALVVSVGSGGALSVLAASLKGWLLQPRRSGVRIRVQGETGRVVEVVGENIDDQHVEALVRQALGDAASED